MVIALVGNPNCGKTSLFNRLTGSRLHTGNFPGVTVELVSGRLRGGGAALVDLPGTYSLCPLSDDERISCDYIKAGKYDALLNVVDANNLERNLYLTLQLLSTPLPVVVALNMTDEVRKNGGCVNDAALSALLGVPVVNVSAATGEGLEQLCAELRRCASKQNYLQRRTLGALPLDPGTQPQELVREVTRRYARIDELCALCANFNEYDATAARTAKADALLTSRFLALPLFAAVMLGVFWLSFSVAGGALSALAARAADAVYSWCSVLLAGSALKHFVCDGVLAAVGGVLSFLPTILTLFLLLSLLEDTGYIARVAFVLDAPLRRIGLCGRSAVPLLLGFGCSVPAIMAARALPDGTLKRRTMLLVPFMSCSAKLPVLTMLCGAFFGRYAALVMLALYLWSILTGIVCAALLRRRGEPEPPLLMEMPPYRFPAAESVLSAAWLRAVDFIKRALGAILLAAIAVWVLGNYGAGFAPVAANDSYLAAAARWLAPVFVPAGLDDWRLVSALISGLAAKETAVTTLMVLTGSTAATLPAALRGIMSAASAAAYLVFTLLYTPCVGAVSVLRREAGVRAAAAAVTVQFSLAWLTAVIIYHSFLCFAAVC